MKYTHFVEALDIKHPISRYWFIVRRKALITQDLELKLLQNEAVLKMLYGDAKRNVLTHRWILPREILYELAAIQLQLSYGNFDSSKFNALIKDPSLVESILPPRTCISKVTIETIMKSYEALKGNSAKHCRWLFLQKCRQSPFYGGAFFAATEEVPPLQLFEYRVQKLLVCITLSGISLLDTRTKVCVLTEG
jgi:Krev interaction trapped protein 1